MILNRLGGYLKDTLGVELHTLPFSKDKVTKLPFYVSEAYQFYDTAIFGHPLILAERRENGIVHVEQTERIIELLKETFAKDVALLLDELPGYERKRLIQRQIAFIVPGKQLFLPEFYIDIRERAQHKPAGIHKGSLLPSAQFLIIHHILHRYAKWKLEGQPLKNIAEQLGYTPMGITKAVENLRHFDLVDVASGKEKSIRFRLERAELWRTLEKQNLLINPVLKRVFVDEKPEGLFMLESNVSALPEYTDMNPAKLEYYAIGRKRFYDMLGEMELVNANDQDGPICLEVWKYDPLPLVDGLGNDRSVVDPLSLYLSLKDLHDERVELALEQIENKFIW
jgi:DNA-binding MarR family transcriptional regulator